MRTNKLYSFPLILILLPLLSVSSGAAGFLNIVAPNNLSTSEGNSLGNFPFAGATVSMRYQQVFDASQFSPIANGGGLINYIGFRVDGGCGGGESVSSQSFQINFSTTSRAPDGLSPTFADNVGHDDMVVWGTRSITLVGACGGVSPNPISVLISLDTPFFYNPSAGNLLMDIRNWSGADPTRPDSLALDAENTVGDSISSITALNVGATTANFVNSRGFATEFGIQVVPEPNPLAFLGLGFLVIVLKRLHSSLKRKKNAAH